MDLQPNKSDIEAVFHRLRTIPANKSCFDCNAKNPTWASVTYGVFICIDCSAVHRSLGVHLSFVRSTQLDTNWTWVQLRQMQLGGNANALQFFSQHNCVSQDAQKKYNSRGAQLYRDKLSHLALKSLETSSELEIKSGMLSHDLKLHIHPHVDDKPEQKEVDFFEEHEHFTSPDLPEQIKKMEDAKLSNCAEPGEGPTVDFSSKPELKSSAIGGRKTQPRKVGLGAKKGGLGATKVKTNFADLEKEATLAEESRLRYQEEAARAAALSTREQEDREAAVRLAYKDISTQQLKNEERVRKMDPKKAEQAERLGMGLNTRTGISHSAMSDMQIIEQENVQTAPSSLSALEKLQISDEFDDFGFGSGFSMNRNTNNLFNINKFADEIGGKNTKDQWVIVDDPPTETGLKSTRTTPRPVAAVDTSSDAAQKKFGSAKAISSDQFFNDRGNDYEVQANLNRFQGSSSISSSEFFGNTKENAGSSSSSSMAALQAYDLEDVRESVRQGVTKVAGRISSLANGVMSSLQERYGY